MTAGTALVLAVLAAPSVATTALLLASPRAAELSRRLSAATPRRLARHRYPSDTDVHRMIRRALRSHR